MNARWAWVLCVWGGVVVSSPAGHLHAQAEVPTASLSYDVPAECPDRQAFEDLVSARLGYVAFVDEAPLSLAVSVSSEDGAYLGTLSPSAQHVRGASCERVSEALGVLVAIAIDPLGEGAAAAAEPERQPLPERLRELDDEAPPPPPAPAAPVEDDAPSGPVPSVRARLHGSFGLAPSASLGGGAGAALRWGAFSIGAEALVETTLLSEGAQSLSGTVWRAGVLSCGSTGVLSACALVQLGQLHGASDAVSSPSRGSALVGYVGARLGVGFDAVGLRWGLELDVLTPFVRPSVMIGTVTAWTAPMIAASLGLSVELEAE